MAKVTRIIFKSISAILLGLILIVLALFFCIQSYSFQTWLGQKVGIYLSSELKTQINIKQIEIDFFTKAKFIGLELKDQKGDTLLFCDLFVDVNVFDFKHQKLQISTANLINSTTKIYKYKNEKHFNYEFLVDYFSSTDSTKTSSSNWKVQLAAIEFNNSNFVYQDKNDTTNTTSNINFNDINIKAISGEVWNIQLSKDSIKANISNLCLSEKSGFRLNTLNTSLMINSSKLYCNELYLKTPATFIKGNLNFDFVKWEDFNQFVEKVNFKAYFQDSTKVSFKDISYFAPALNNLNESLEISGNIKGRVDDLHLKKIKIKYKKFTRFEGNLDVTGLPILENCYLHFNAKPFSTNYYDLIEIPNYPFSQNNRLHVPKELESLGTISYTGKFDGLIKDFTTFGNFNTSLGKINTEISIQFNNPSNEMAYQGKITTDDFYLGKLIGQNNFNALSMQCIVNGKGTTINTINSEIDLAIKNVVFQNYNYKQIHLQGTLKEKLFDGVLNCLDTNANFNFNGSVDFKNKVPEMYFISTINYLNLNKLHLSNLVDSGQFSTQLFINIKGDNLNNLYGQINFDNTIYKTKTKAYKLNQLNLDIDQTSDLKSILFKSTYFNAGINGRFELGNLYNAFVKTLYHYYPSYFTKPIKEHTFKDELSFFLNIKNFETIHELFLPELMLSKGSVLKGNYNASNQNINFNFNSNEIKYQLFDLKQFSINLSGENKNISTHAFSKFVNAGDSVNIDNFSFNLKSKDTASVYRINWDNQKQPSSKGTLNGRIIFNSNALTMYNDSINVCVNDSSWVLEKPNQINITKQAIHIEPMIIFRHQQKIQIQGVFSENINDSLLFNVNQLNLGQFNPLLRLINMKAEGELNGTVSLANPNKNLAFNGNLNLQKLKINENLIGELSVNSHYNTNDNFVLLNGFTSLGLQDELGNQIKNISFFGHYYLDKRAESIDINFKANPANLKLLNPILKDILTIKNGYVNGDIKIHGSPQKILLDGKLRLFNSEIKVDYTNVTYNLSGDIDILTDQIRFSDLYIREKGTKSAPQGTLNGNIFHSNFKRIQLDYDISYKNMLVLNTTEKENKTFYGKIYSTGNVGIYGYLNNLNMQIFDTVTKNSKFIMPLDGPNEIEDEDFVHFVKKDTVKIKNKKEISGFNLDLSIMANPSTSVQIILDKQNGDMLNAQGQANLSLKINTLGKFEMTGDYIITNGDYLFTLEHVINKKFDIEAGSSISWNGNPSNAEIAVSTSYKQRTSVAPLLEDTTGAYKSRLAVDCKLLLSGKLFSPIIKFAFDFPNLDATAKSRIASVLSDEGELNRQVFSFLLFRNFVKPQIFNTNQGGVTASGAAASTGSELLSNKISGFLNNYLDGFSALKDLHLGLNYRPGTQTNKETVDLALSKQFLNNKISVDGNFGVNNNQTSNSGNLIGDVNIDYKLTDDGRYRLTGFNRTNNNVQITTSGGAYTQGVGFFYRREFNTLKEFFDRNKIK